MKVSIMLAYKGIYTIQCKSKHFGKYCINYISVNGVTLAVTQNH